MTYLFILANTLVSYTIWSTGAWTDDSPRIQDLLAMLLLALIAIVLAFTFAPYTDLGPLDLIPLVNHPTFT
jgi:D-alanyl-lipoteichoic acid acyltransferase DltB (MBOAT superfamily)